MTLNEYAYEIWEEIRPNIVDDDSIDIRLIKRLIDNQRTLWVENDINKGEDPTRYAQSLGTIDLILKPSSYDETTLTGKIMMVTTGQAIPVPIYRNGKPLFTLINPLDMRTVQYKYVEPQSAWSRGNGTFNSLQTFVTYANGKIELFGNNLDFLSGLKSIHVEGVFERPTDVASFNDETSEYPMSEKLWAYLKSQVVKILREKIFGPEDKINDSTNENIETRSK